VEFKLVSSLLTINCAVVGRHLARYTLLSVPVQTFSAPSVWSVMYVVSCISPVLSNTWLFGANRGQISIDESYRIDVFAHVVPVYICCVSASEALKFIVHSNEQTPTAGSLRRLLRLTCFVVHIYTKRWWWRWWWWGCPLSQTVC
jgi:hypothetical protein